MPRVVEDSGLAEGGWVPVDQRSLATRFPGVYAVGDVTSVGTPKAGVFAEGQAAVIADRILAMARADGADTRYGGEGICYLEFGNDLVATVTATFLPGTSPTGLFAPPSAEIAAAKAQFGSSRIARWFS